MLFITGKIKFSYKCLDLVLTNSYNCVSHSFLASVFLDHVELCL